MNENKHLLPNTLLLIAIFCFDIFVIIGYFLYFSLFNLLTMEISILILFILLFSLALINFITLNWNKMEQEFGAAHIISIMTLSILYALLANFFSYRFFYHNIDPSNNIIWKYVMWELFGFALLLALSYIIVTYAAKVSVNMDSTRDEQSRKATVNIQLLNIESILTDPDISHSFKILKDRIQASTPFGRFKENSAEAQIERRIWSNLTDLQDNLEQNITDNSKLKILNLIDDTLNNVINRENLMIK